MSSSPQLSLVSKQEAAAELLKRRNARASLHDFIRYINPDYIVSDFSRKVCSELDTFLEDMAAGKRPILILGAPPQHGKALPTNIRQSTALTKQTKLTGLASMRRASIRW